MKIGVLALQGDFAEHQVMLERLGADVTQVRLPQHLDDLDGLIIPGVNPPPLANWQRISS